jgi:tRNA modification GTPase
VSKSATVAACLTPAGAAAIAVIGVQGPAAWPTVSALLQRPALLDRTSQRLVRITDGQQSDQVVLTRPGDDLVEVHCHGGIGVVRWILGLLRRRGVEEIDWKEWLRRTSPSFLQAEAAIALAQAPTIRTAGVLLDQVHGACDRAIASIHTALEERRIGEAQGQMEELLARVSLGRHLTTPWRVVLAGAPNVGKSTLLNALLGYERAISSPTPGTTRDVVRSTTAFDGWLVELVDTAGLRESTQFLEAAGVQRARQELSAADLGLWIFDASQPPIVPPAEIERKAVFVVNKIDLPWRWSPESEPKFADACQVSALTRAGLEALARRIVDRLVPQPPASGAAVPVGAIVAGCLESARECLQAGDVAGSSARLMELLGPPPDAQDPKGVPPHCARHLSQ